MSEEGAFLQAILADPDDESTLKVYADWLEERADPRSEYVRHLLAPALQETHVAALRQRFDSAWLGVLDSLRFRAGDDVRITAGVYQGMEGQIITLAPARGCAGVIPRVFGRPTLIEIKFDDLIPLKVGVNVGSLLA
jgi:uncharacterized protein (TIGR02996 family)